MRNRFCSHCTNQPTLKTIPFDANEFAFKYNYEETLKFLIASGLDLNGLISAAVKKEDWDVAITLMTEKNASFDKQEFEKILNAVFTLDMAVNRENIIDFLQHTISILLPKFHKDRLENIQSDYINHFYSGDFFSKGS